jgi:hypothetical protein
VGFLGGGFEQTLKTVAFAEELLDGKHARKVLSKKLRRARKISFAKGVEWMLLNGSKVVMKAAVTSSVNGCKTMTFKCHHQKG